MEVRQPIDEAYRDLKSYRKYVNTEQNTSSLLDRINKPLTPTEINQLGQLEPIEIRTERFWSTQETKRLFFTLGDMMAKPILTAECKWVPDVGFRFRLFASSHTAFIVEALEYDLSSNDVRVIVKPVLSKSNTSS